MNVLQSLRQTLSTLRTHFGALPWREAPQVLRCVPGEVRDAWRAPPRLDPIRAFRHALAGLRAGWHSQAAIVWEAHIGTGLVALASVGWLFGLLDGWKIPALAACAGAVLVAELLNTAVETLGDKVSPTHDELVGRAKDLGASAVLITIGTSTTAALAIFAS